MRILSPILCAAALLAPAALAADVLVMSDGRVFHVEGPIQFDGDFVRFQMSKTHQHVTFRRFEVDENKTRALNGVLDSDVHGLPRLRRVEAIESQSSRSRARSVPMVEERPKSEQTKRMELLMYGGSQHRTRPFPSEDLAETRARRQQEREAARSERSERLAAAAKEREQKRAARAAEREERRQQMRESHAAAQVSGPKSHTTIRTAPAPAPAPDKAAPAREDPRVASYQARIEVLDGQIREARDDLKRLTDLQKDASQEFEGTRLQSVDAEIDRLLKRIERLESRKSSVQERLNELQR